MSYLTLSQYVVAVGALAFDPRLDGGDLLLHRRDVLLDAGEVLACLRK